MMRSYANCLMRALLRASRRAPEVCDAGWKPVRNANFSANLLILSQLFVIFAQIVGRVGLQNSSSVSHSMGSGSCDLEIIIEKYSPII